MFNPSSNNPAYYSEKNDTSEFRFILMTSNRFEPAMKVEHKCSLCGTVQVTTGYTLNHPSGIPTIVCVDCAGTETQFCGECDDEIDTSEIAETVEVPDDYDLPQGVKHFAFICTECIDNPSDTDDLFNIEETTMTVSNETQIFDFPKDPEAAATEKRLDEAFQRLEDKVTALQDYFAGRNALFQDHRDGEITLEEVEAGLERLRSRLK